MARLWRPPLVPSLKMVTTTDDTEQRRTSWNLETSSLTSAQYLWSNSLPTSRVRRSEQRNVSERCLVAGGVPCLGMTVVGKLNLSGSSDESDTCTSYQAPVSHFTPSFCFTSSTRSASPLLFRASDLHAKVTTEGLSMLHFLWRVGAIASHR